MGKLSSTAHDHVATRARYILPVIVCSQLAGTSLWFAGNAVLPELQAMWSVGAKAVGLLTSAVQVGFIAGTLLFALLSIADRHSPRGVFLVCSLLGALANGLSVLVAADVWAFAACRFLTGMCLAGVYPVGMKIAAGWFQGGLGAALGWLVGALAVGTALPHLIRAAGMSLPWPGVLLASSGLAIAGGLLMAGLVPNGPYMKQSPRFDPRAIRQIFRSAEFRAASFGYFGHMWELYTYWAFLPVVLAAYGTQHGVALPASLWAFAAIAAGGVGCVVGGYLASRLGSAAVAFGNLALSGLCCLLSPLFFFAPPPVFLAFLLLWGAVVVGDSPQFSTLTARMAPPELVGSALAIVISIGFAITVVSIQAITALAAWVPPHLLLVGLALGPALGLWRMRSLLAR